MSKESKELITRLAVAHARAKDGQDPLLWRTALGQATIDLLEAGKAVTIEELIRHLETQMAASDDSVLRTISTDAAIARLRSLWGG